MDFVCKYVRVIGRHQGGITRFITFNNISTFPHFLQVEQSAERCVSTLLDLIQTKVNYVVQVNQILSQ